MGKKVVFVTNNGLTDHIGTAQILPYLERLSGRGHLIQCITIERSKTQDTYIKDLKNRISDSNLIYNPVHSKKKFLGKFWSTFGLFFKTIKSCLLFRPDILHCRSYMPLPTVLFAHILFKIPFVFDMRGFWIDERIEGGAWDNSKTKWKIVIGALRFLERLAIRRANHIVVLTNDAKSVVERSSSYGGASITVIPCSVDREIFCINESMRLSTREEFGFEDDEYVLAYLGSSGSLYRMDMVYRLYSEIKKLGLRPKILLIGEHDLSKHIEAAAAINISVEMNDLICQKIPHCQVPRMLNAADLGLSFRLQSPSSLGVSATKVGEYLSCGLPVVTSDGIGDIREIIKNFKNGYVFSNLDSDEVNLFLDVWSRTPFMSRENIRRSSKIYFDINLAVDKYDELYNGI